MGLFDNLFGSSDTSAQGYLQQALAAYQNLQTPTIASESLGTLPQETVQGQVTPEAIQAVNQAPSAYNNISLNPASRQAQLSALAAYQDIANSGGLDAESKAALQQTIDAATQQARGEQGAIQQQAQAMGQGGGDFALTQRALAAQGASNTAATNGLNAAAMAEANREAALANMGNLGGSINASEYGQAANAAQAQNAINAANQGYANAANVGNVSNNMAGQQFNVSNAQNVNAANTGAGINKAYYQANLPQQQFNNELAKAGGIAGVSGSQANAAQQAAANQSAMAGKLLGAAGTIGGAAIGGPVGAAIGGQAANTMAATPKTSTGYASSGVQQAAHGGVVCYAKGGYSIPHDHSICMKMGGHVGGEAEVPGDSERNDTVPALLSPGELVIPRSVPKDGPHMEEFARKAPVAGTNKKVNLAEFTKNYRRPR